MSHFTPYPSTIINPATGSAGTLGRNAAGTTTINSLEVDTRFFVGCSFQCVMSNGDATGSLVIQASNDSGSWVTVDGAGVAFSGSQSKLINMDGIHWALTRAQYTNVSNSGSLTVKFSGKGY